MASDIDYNDPWGSKAGEEQYNVAKEHGLVTAKRGGNYDQFFDQDIPDDRPFKQRISPAVPVRHIQTRYDIALNKPGRTEPVDASETAPVPISIDRRCLNCLYWQNPDYCTAGGCHNQNLFVPKSIVDHG